MDVRVGVRKLINIFCSEKINRSNYNELGPDNEISPKRSHLVDIKVCERIVFKVRRLP